MPEAVSTHQCGEHHAIYTWQPQDCSVIAKWWTISGSRLTELCVIMYSKQRAVITWQLFLNQCKVKLCFWMKNCSQMSISGPLGARGINYVGFLWFQTHVRDVKCDCLMRNVEFCIDISYIVECCIDISYIVGCCIDISYIVECCIDIFRYCGVLYRYIVYCGVLCRYIVYCGVLYRYIVYCGVLYRYIVYALE